MKVDESICVKVRQHIIKMIFSAQEGHIGSSFSCVEILTALYFFVLNVRPNKPKWENRDRFILSKGHAAPTLYSILAMKGYFPIDELKNFRKYGSILQGHPDMTRTPGVDMSSGSLGNGLACAVGMALFGKKKNKKYSIFVLVGDGETQEGIVWEAAMTASHYNLDNLIVIQDNNGLQINGAVSEIMKIDNICERWSSFGWEVSEVDGHDLEALTKLVSELKSKKNGFPKLIIANTIKGKGIDFMENTKEWHSKIPNSKEYNKGIEILNKKSVAYYDDY